MEQILRVIETSHLTDLAAIVVVFALAAAVVWAGRRVLNRSLERLEMVSPENRAAVHSRARQLLGAVRLVTYGVAVIASLALALARLGIIVPSWSPRKIVEWTLSHGLHIMLIVAGAYITLRAATLVVEHLAFKTTIGATGADLERHRRAATLSGIVANTFSAVIAAIGLLMVLRELSIDVVPLLTGAGIAGLAIGFGAQNLVRDVISGFFIILENQVRVGDLARVNGIDGIVEEMNLRTIVVRDVQGAVHVFPNGAITALANLSKDFSYAVVDVAVARGEDLGRAIDTLHEIGAAMRHDERLQTIILAPLEVFGIEAMTPAEVTIRTRFRTAPLTHGEVAREFRRRVVETFAARGIPPVKL